MASTAQSNKFQLTPEQIALSLERKTKRNAALSQSNSSSEPDEGLIIERSWIPIEPFKNVQQHVQCIKVLTWNLLAQCLVRRDLFPTSNCLKANQREQMLYRELLSTQADVLCLQEVDRLEKLYPVLKQAGYAYHYAAGPGKKHGCLVAFKDQLFTLLRSKTVLYDDEDVSLGGNEMGRRGNSFRTKNIGTLVSLRNKTTENGEGVIVATTHLFWHPRYTYERARQAGVLVRETARFRTEQQLDHWPCVISGDFNFAPDDPAYSLLVGNELLPDHEQRIRSSHVVHVSVDPTVPGTPKAVSEEGDEDTVDSDRVITNARPATPSDGLLSPSELVEFFSHIPAVQSAYDLGLARVKHREGLQTFGDRVIIEQSRQGSNEPEYTSYTHYWKTVLDYIFILNPVDRQSTVVALLSPHKAADLKPGLPQKGVSSSDHVSLAAELSWPKNAS